MRGAGAACALVALTLGCGDQDVTTLQNDEASENPLEPEPVAADSRIFSVLSERQSLDAVCRLLGVSSVSGAGASSAGACEQVVERCRGNVQAVLGSGDGAGPAVGLPTGSLEPLLGCPLSFAELDGCVAGVLERSVEAYGSSVSCDMPALPEVDTIRLLSSPECLSVVLLCPQLVTGFAERR